MPEHIDEHDEHEQGPDEETLDAKTAGAPEARNSVQPTLQPLSEDDKKDFALAALESMDLNMQRDVVRQLQLLPEEDRKAIILAGFISGRASTGGTPS